MGSQAFDRDQLRLAWVAIIAAYLWFLWGIVVTNAPYNRMDGNTLVLIREHTDYTTYYGYWFGEGGVVFYGLLTVVVLGVVTWLWRGYRDGWDFLYRSGGDTRRPSARPDFTAGSAGETLTFGAVLAPVVPIVAIEGLARVGLWPLGPAASAVAVFTAAVGVAALAWRYA